MMEVQGQDGYLLWMDELHPDIQKGSVLMNQRTEEQVVVMYIDREENVLGFLPISEF
jgi:hypothetical protein